MKPLFYYLAIVSLIGCTSPSLPVNAQPSLVFTGYGSGSYSSGNQKKYESIVIKSKLKAVDILYTCYTENESDHRIDCSSYDSPKEKNFTRVLKSLKASGYHVTMRVYVDLKNQKWRAYWQPKNIKRAFTNLERLLTRFAKVAKFHRVDTFIIGSEYEGLTKAQYLEYWKKIIKAVKARYSGNIVYAANGNLNKGPLPEYHQVPFWYLLDTIGINYYPPFKGKPNQPNLMKHHKEQLKKIKDYANLQKKKLAVTEVGFPLAASGIKTPYKWNYPAAEKPNQKLRSLTMKAFITNTKTLKIKDIHFWRHLIKERSIHPLGYVIDEEFIKSLKILNK